MKARTKKNRAERTSHTISPITIISYFMYSLIRLGPKFLGALNKFKKGVDDQ